MIRRSLILLSGLGALLLAACAQSQHTAWHDLDAAYASQVPLRSGVALIERSAGPVNASQTHGASPVAATWRFRTGEDLKTLVAFYERELPGAQRTPEDDGLVCFTFVPNGAGLAEFVIVLVGQGEIRISEQTAPDRHRANASM